MSKEERKDGMDAILVSLTLLEGVRGMVKLLRSDNKLTVLLRENQIIDCKRKMPVGKKNLSKVYLQTVEVQKAILVLYTEGWTI